MISKNGFTAQQAMDAVVAATPHRDWRQLAIIDREGRTASFSGERVKPEKSEAHGRNCVALGNIVRSREVPAAMVRAFEADTSARIGIAALAALEAGDEAGGEFKPLVSAALLLVDRETFPIVDLRVDQDGAPIAALARLWQEYAPMAQPYVARAVDPNSARRSETRRNSTGGAACDASFSRWPWPPGLRRPALAQGTIRVAVGTTLNQLDPAKTTIGDEYIYVHLVFNGLTRIDRDLTPSPTSR